MLYLILFFISCIGATWLSVTFIVEPQIMSKQYWAEICLLLFVFIFSIDFLIRNCALKKSLHSKRKDRLYDNKLCIQICFAIIIVNASMQALYGFGQLFFPSIGSERITGSFDNPAGFAICLCASMPFILAFRPQKISLKVLLLFDLLLKITAIVLSESRAGMVSVAVMAGIYVLRRCSVPFWKKIVLSVVVLFVLLLGVYAIKKDSADGRLLIWRCSWEMIKDRALLGYGLDGFKLHYMDYQAEWFATHPNSHFVQLADTVQRPFNEYLAVWISFGMMGLLLLALIIVFLIHCCQGKCYLPPNQSVILSLCGIGVFAFFSYPFTYSIVWIIVLFDILVIISNRDFIFRLLHRVGLILALILIPCCLVLSMNLSETIAAEIQWKKVVQYSAMASKEEWQPLYEKLERPMRSNPYFLYNYSAKLYEAGCYEESLAIARKCCRFWSDYDLEMLIAQSYYHLKEYRLADMSFVKASQMCPNRFFPLYYRMCLYEELGEPEQAKCIAQQIVGKPVKVSSIQVEKMKLKARQIISVY